jgi:hypothetical protein
MPKLPRHTVNEYDPDRSPRKKKPKDAEMAKAMRAGPDAVSRLLDKRRGKNRPLPDYDNPFSPASKSWMEQQRKRQQKK